MGKATVTTAVFSEYVLVRVICFVVVATLYFLFCFAIISRILFFQVISDVQRNLYL